MHVQSLWVVQIYPNTGEQLTRWTCVQSFSSVVLISSTPESNSLSGYMFSHSSHLFKHRSNSHTGCIFNHPYQWFQSTQTPESYSHARWVFNHFHQWFKSAQTLERDSHPGYIFSHSYQRLKNTGEQLTRWMHVQPFSSTVLILNTEEQLTSWMHIQQF